MNGTATIRSSVADPEAIAQAIAPDNTAEMDTRVEDGDVVTTVRRDSTAGLRSTVDDYVVNLQVALAVADTANRRETTTDTAHS
jgi:tRNA threonylcarbamoyladenosine modification (KEOPS) complex  Pcc1 subunit